MIRTPSSIISATVLVLVVGAAPWAPAASPAAATATVRPARAADPTLGNGLGRLLAEPDISTRQSADGLQVDQGSLSIQDADNRVLIHLTPRSAVDALDFRVQAERLGLRVQSVDEASGTLEGFADESAIRQLARLPGTGTIAQALKPLRQAADTTSQGVPFQRIDAVQAAGVDGTGITIGALSDSFDTARTDAFGLPLLIHASDDVASGDLPGPGDPRHPAPVIVTADFPDRDATDEGRAVLQIAHDVAPAAELCFATAYTGYLDFAASIRRLAEPAGLCGADVLVDDVSYLEEPFFSDGPIADAVDDVTRGGVSYFSSAGNQGERKAWQSAVDLVPVADGPVGANLDLTQLAPELYDGGLQDMDPGAAVDVAQTVALGDDGGVIDLQWDDPVDPNGIELGDSVFTGTGDFTDATLQQSFEFVPTADLLGGEMQFTADAVPSGSTDLMLEVTGPDGSNLGTADAGLSPEVLLAKLDQAGTYVITISGFEGTSGQFTVDVRPFLAPATTTTDFNLLIFDVDGRYLTSIADANTLTGRPFEIGPLRGLAEVQIAIGRAQAGPRPQATTLRYVMYGDMFAAEYVDPLAPAIFGHAAAAGAIAVAAYDPFRPYLPESFTSPGGHLPIYFDSAGNRFATPQIRQKPEIASADGGNTTFFGLDSVQDADTRPNFFGTSAAAPHAAAIAALLLQHNGGPGSLTPDEVRARLQESTFAHDLDPHHSSGTAAGLTISADGPAASEDTRDAGSMADANFFDVTYTGAVPLRSITFFGESADPTAPGTRRRPLSDGIVFDPRPFTGDAPFTDQGFPFTVGATSGGLDADTVSASFSAPAPAPSVPGQYRHLTVTFGQGLSTGGGLSFGVDRDTAVVMGGPSREGNSADQLGGATFLPQGRTWRYGLAFVATRIDGSRTGGVLVNKLGDGWTPVDGYGLVNAERAVLGAR